MPLDSIVFSLKAFQQMHNQLCPLSVIGNYDARSIIFFKNDVTKSQENLFSLELLHNNF